MLPCPECKGGLSPITVNQDTRGMTYFYACSHCPYITTRPLDLNGPDNDLLSQQQTRAIELAIRAGDSGHPEDWAIVETELDECARLYLLSLGRQIHTAMRERNRAAVEGHAHV